MCGQAGGAGPRASGRGDVCKHWLDDSKGKSVPLAMVWNWGLAQYIGISRPQGMSLSQQEKSCTAVVPLPIAVRASVPNAARLALE